MMNRLSLWCLDALIFPRVRLAGELILIYHDDYGWNFSALVVGLP